MPHDEEMPSGKKGGKLDPKEDASDSMEDDMTSAKGGAAMGMDGMPPLQPGRVVLVVPDMELVEFFRQQVCVMCVRVGVGVGIHVWVGVWFACVSVGV